MDSDTSQAPTHLTRFLEALSSVYGPLPPSSHPHPLPHKSDGHQGRYLWTDAFGLINLVTLYHLTSNTSYLSLAKSLVSSVHSVLGRTRDGKHFLEGGSEDEPMGGGLRSGILEESEDGMILHYLWMWMFALNRLSLASGEPEFNSLAVELATAIHPAFVKVDGDGKKRTVWKIGMSVKSVEVKFEREGEFDVVMGWVVLRLLGEGKGGEGKLEREIGNYGEMVEERVKEGRLGVGFEVGKVGFLGMGLWVCGFGVGEVWAGILRGKCLEGAMVLLKENGPIFGSTAQHRVAYSEFGACLGISCDGRNEYLKGRADAIIQFWEDYMQQVTADDLRPISLVMYAAALIPGAFKKDFFET